MTVMDNDCHMNSTPSPVLQFCLVKNLPGQDCLSRNIHKLNNTKDDGSMMDRLKSVITFSHGLFVALFLPSSCDVTDLPIIIMCSQQGWLASLPRFFLLLLSVSAREAGNFWVRNLSCLKAITDLACRSEPNGTCAEKLPLYIPGARFSKNWIHVSCLFHKSHLESGNCDLWFSFHISHFTDHTSHNKI